MKTKAKLILTMSVLTAGVVAAGATGTFAWFTTNRAAQLNYTSVTAQKNAGNLQVWMGRQNSAGDGWEEITEATTGGSTMAAASVAAATPMSDVSSQDGVTFWKPIWKTVSGEGKAIDRLDVGSRTVDYSVFYFMVENSGTRNLEVYLNSATGINPATGAAKDTNAASFTRIAINKTVQDGDYDYPKIDLQKSTPTWTIEKDNGSTSDGKYLAWDGQEGTKPSTATSTAITDASINLFKIKDDAPLSSITSSSKVAKQKLCTLAPKNTEGYRAWFTVSVWLEGTKSDLDAFQNAVGGEVNITLDLAGVEA